MSNPGKTAYVSNYEIDRSKPSRYIPTGITMCSCGCQLYDIEVSTFKICEYCREPTHTYQVTTEHDPRIHRANYVVKEVDGQRQITYGGEFKFPINKLEGVEKSVEILGLCIPIEESWDRYYRVEFWDNVYSIQALRRICEEQVTEEHRILIFPPHLFYVFERGNYLTYDYCEHKICCYPEDAPYALLYRPIDAEQRSVQTCAKYNVDGSQCYLTQSINMPTGIKNGNLIMESSTLLHFSHLFDNPNDTTFCRERGMLSHQIYLIGFWVETDEFIENIKIYGEKRELCFDLNTPREKFFFLALSGDDKHMLDGRPVEVVRNHFFLSSVETTPLVSYKLYPASINLHKSDGRVSDYLYSL